MSFLQPGRGDVHVDRPLTNMSLAIMQALDGFIADRVFPNIPTQSKSDSYFEIPRGAFNRDEMQARAPGAESAGAGYDVTTRNFSVDVVALHKDIADQVRANTDDPLSPDREALEFLGLKAMIARERTWATKYFGAGIWATDLTGVDNASPTSVQFGRWDRVDSTPIEDVRSAKRTVQESTGLRPNKMVMGREVYDALLDHPDIVGRIDRGQTPGGPAQTLRETLAALFELEEILVMDSIVNTALEGATDAHSFIGGKSALLVSVPASAGLMTPSAGYTFSWVGYLGAASMGQRISRFRMEHLKSDRIEMEMAYDQVVVATELGFFFASAVN